MLLQSPYRLKTMFDFEGFDSDIIVLDPALINQAIQLSQQSHQPQYQWSIYLNSLALFGFQQWLRERAPDLKVEQQSIIQAFSLMGAAICGLQVANFKICLIVQGVLLDQLIPLPVSTIEQPDLRSQFYVLMEVQEEWSQVTIQGFLRYDQLLHHQQAGGRLLVKDQNYEIPLDWFNRNSNQLLLYCQCLQPEVISIANSPTPSDSIPEKSLLLPLSLIPPANSPKVVNVGLWLQNELDEIAQQLHWMLLPQLASALRVTPQVFPEQELEGLITKLEHQLGKKLLPQCRGAYQDIGLADCRLRLYAVTWSLESKSNDPEWTLLLILGTQPNYLLPANVTWQITDGQQILVQQTLKPDSSEPFLFANLVGNWEEQFGVIIELEPGTSLSLPPFIFQPPCE